MEFMPRCLKKGRSCGGTARCWPSAVLTQFDWLALFLEAARFLHGGDPTSLTGLGLGDPVRFEIERDGPRNAITRLVDGI